MEWTKEAPTETGWYWYLNELRDTPVVIWCGRYFKDMHVPSVKCEFFMGPLPVPDKPEDAPC